MNILLLGAGGFVGSHLVEHLVSRREHEVIALDVSDEKLAHLDPMRFRFYRHDVTSDGRLIGELIRGSDVVVDLIAYANPSLYVSAPLDVFELNFLRNLEIAKLCVRHGKRLIQYSSAEVYGKAAGDGALCEEEVTDSVFGPVNKSRWIYATGKVLLERVLHAYGETGQLEYTIVRPFNFLGSRIDYLVPARAVGGPRVFPHFMSALLTGGPIRLVDGGHVHRAFLHIEDANQAFQTLLDRRGAAHNQVFNIGNPENDTTIRGLALLMLEIYRDIMGHDALSQLEDISGEAFYGAGYEDSDRLPPDITKLRALGWEPRYDLRSTLADAMRFYLPSTRAVTQPPAVVSQIALVSRVGDRQARRDIETAVVEGRR